MKLHKYTEKELVHAVSVSTSVRQTLLYPNVAPFGGNYDVPRKATDHFGLDTSHFTGHAWNEGRRLTPRKTLNEYLTRNSNISSFKLKQCL